MLSASQRLLNAPAVRVNNGSVFGRGNLWNNVFSARTGQELSFAGDKGIVVPSLYWSVLDFGRKQNVFGDFCAFSDWFSAVDSQSPAKDA